jgi:hypothetical protein
MTHLNAEEIAQADLINVVGNVLVVNEISSRYIAVSRLNRNVGLKKFISTIIALKVVSQLTIVVPARSGWTQAASFHFGGAIRPLPQVEWLPCCFARLPAL